MHTNSEKYPLNGSNIENTQYVLIDLIMNYFTITKARIENLLEENSPERYYVSPYFLQLSTKDAVKILLENNKTFEVFKTTITHIFHLYEKEVNNINTQYSLKIFISDMLDKNFIKFMSLLTCKYTKNELSKITFILSEKDEINEKSIEVLRFLKEKWFKIAMDNFSFFTSWNNSVKNLKFLTNRWFAIDEIFMEGHVLAISWTYMFDIVKRRIYEIKKEWIKSVVWKNLFLCDKKSIALDLWCNWIISEL